MGLFLFVAAVKGKQPLEIAASIKIYLDQIGFKTEIKSAEKFLEEFGNDYNHTDVSQFESFTSTIKALCSIHKYCE